MLTVERTRSLLGRLPLLARLGLAVVVIGGLGDLAAHALAGGPNAAHEHTAAELMGHLIAFMGMVLILLLS